MHTVLICTCRQNTHPNFWLFSFSDFIVQFLEQQVCTLNWDVGFVIQTMNEIGVPLPRLLEVYDQLFKSRVREPEQASLSFPRYRVGYFDSIFIDILSFRLHVFSGDWLQLCK